jgi:hypothetical protein
VLNPIAIAIASAALATVVLAASWWPARQASRFDALTLLRRS